MPTKLSRCQAIYLFSAVLISWPGSSRSAGAARARSAGGCQGSAAATSEKAARREPWHSDPNSGPAGAASHDCGAGVGVRPARGRGLQKNPHRLRRRQRSIPRRPTVVRGGRHSGLSHHGHVHRRLAPQKMRQRSPGVHRSWQPRGARLRRRAQTDQRAAARLRGRVPHSRDPAHPGAGREPAILQGDHGTRARSMRPEAGGEAVIRAAAGPGSHQRRAAPGVLVTAHHSAVFLDQQSRGDRGTVGGDTPSDGTRSGADRVSERLVQGGRQGVGAQPHERHRRPDAEVADAPAPVELVAEHRHRDLRHARARRGGRRPRSAVVHDGRDPGKQRLVIDVVDRNTVRRAVDQPEVGPALRRGSHAGRRPAPRRSACGWCPRRRAYCRTRRRRAVRRRRGTPPAPARARSSPAGSTRPSARRACRASMAPAPASRRRPATDGR